MVWQEGANYGGVADVRGVRLGGSGAVSAVITISSAPGEQLWPGVAAHPAGGALAVWQDGRHAVGSGIGHYVIYGARLDSGGAVLEADGDLIGGLVREVSLIRWPRPGDLVYGTPLSEAQLNATASVPGVFTYSPPLGTCLHAGPSQTLSVRFTPADPARYTEASASVPINVLPALLTIRADDKTKFAGKPNPPLTAN